MTTTCPYCRNAHSNGQHSDGWCGVCQRGTYTITVPFTYYARLLRAETKARVITPTPVPGSCGACGADTGRDIAVAYDAGRDSVPVARERLVGYLAAVERAAVVGNITDPRILEAHRIAVLSGLPRGSYCVECADALCPDCRGLLSGRSAPHSANHGVCCCPSVQSLPVSTPPSAPSPRDEGRGLDALAAALPVNEEADRRVDALFARQPLGPARTSVAARDEGRAREALREIDALASELEVQAHNEGVECERGGPHEATPKAARKALLDAVARALSPSLGTAPNSSNEEK
jgi:hypothetical protein